MKQTKPTSPPIKIKLLSTQTDQFIWQRWNPPKGSDTRIYGEIPCTNITDFYHFSSHLFSNMAHTEDMPWPSWNLWNLRKKATKTNTTSPVLENTLKPEKYCKKRESILQFTVTNISLEIVYTDGMRTTEVKHVLSMPRLNDCLCFPHPDGCLLEPKEMRKGTMEVLNS